MNFPVADKVKKVCGHSLILRGSPGRKLVLAIDSVLMTSRTRISDLPATTDGSTVVVGGFVETVRDQKKVQFIILRDETGSVH